MKKNRALRRAILAACLAAWTASGAALAVDEVEPNYPPMSSAQPLSIGADGSVTVNAFLSAGEADVFSFEARAGDLVTADVDGGMKSGSGSVDTFLAIHSPALAYKALSWNDDSGKLDPDSTSPWDPLIENYRIPADGVYYVAVTGSGNRIADGGAFVDWGNRQSGSYTLILSGVSPTAVSIKQISIEIKPGAEGKLAPINTRARGTIPVALLSDATFDALQVDRESLTFGHSGDEESLRRCGKDGEDVDGDGLLDLVCHFDNQAAEFQSTDDRGYLKGTIGGVPFEGNGMLKVIPAKPKKTGRLPGTP